MINAVINSGRCSGETTEEETIYHGIGVVLVDEVKFEKELTHM